MTKPFIEVTDGVAYQAKRTPFALFWVELGPVPTLPSRSPREEILQLIEAASLSPQRLAWCQRRLARMPDERLPGLLRRFRKIGLR